MITTFVRPRAVIAAAVTLSALFAGACGSGGTPAESPRLETSGPEVLSDADGTGIDVSERLFERSEAVVVASPSRDAQLHGAAVAADALLGVRFQPVTMVGNDRTILGVTVTATAVRVQKI